MVLVAVNIPIKGFILLWLLQDIGGELPGCKKEDWKLFRPGNKFWKMIHNNATWDEATINCERLGGQLLVLHDGSPLTYYKALWGAETDYWVGLSKSTDGVYTWIDGTGMVIATCLSWSCHKLWTLPARCCYIRFHQKPFQLLVKGCQTTASYICEAKRPCAARPVITIDDGPRLEGRSNMSLSEARVVKIECSLRGYLGLHNQLSFHCSWERTSKLTTGRSIIKRVFMSFNFYRKICSCVSTTVDQRMENTTVEVSFNIAPRLVHSEDNYTDLVLDRTKDIQVTFRVIANPPPSGYTLTFEETIMPKCKVIFRPLESPMIIEVQLMMKAGNAVPGRYTLTIFNGIGSGFHYVFDLQWKGVAFSANWYKSDTHFGLCVAAIIFVFILGFLFLAFQINKEGFADEVTWVESEGLELPEFDLPSLTPAGEQSELTKHSGSSEDSNAEDSDSY